MTPDVSMMAAAIAALVDRLGGASVSFVELDRHIAGFHTDDPEEQFARYIAENCLVWFGLSRIGAEALDIARTEGPDPIVYWPAAPLVYLIDGAGLALPLARYPRAYKRPRWYPVTLCRRSYYDSREGRRRSIRPTLLDRH